MTEAKTGLEALSNQELITLQQQRQILLDNVNMEIWWRQNQGRFV